MTEREYNNCVKDYADKVYRFVLKNLKNIPDAEDIVQSSFEVLWQKRKDIISGNPKSFLFTIAYRKMIDLVRKNKRMDYHEEMSLFDVNSIHDDNNNELRNLLGRALDTLDPTKRALVLLKDYEGYSYEEIGQITELSGTQVKVYLHRARLQLRQYLTNIENIIK